MSHSGYTDETYDLLVIGGGINGAGIACDAAGRGLKTALLESVDFASGTSSRSSKLIHGGLRYLEYYDFRLVRESLSERERLMTKARHIAWPLRFVMPVVPQSRPAWLVRIGLFLYDHLASRVTLKGTETIRLSQKPDQLGFKSQYDKAFVYSDCWVDDARLVVANLQGAQGYGADIYARTQFKTAERRDNHWHISVLDENIGCEKKLQARIIVNAAGPWAVPIAKSVPGVDTDYSAKLVRGSHIIVPRLYDGNNATMLQLSDERIVVTMPFENEFTLVGTTDADHPGDPRDAVITDEERDYLLSAANHFFERQTRVEDIVWTYSGVRPLFEEGKSRDSNPTTVTRDYSFKIDTGADGEGAPFLTVLGGKLTTYRRLADHVMIKLKPFLPADIGPGKTKDDLLPGADIGSDGPLAYTDKLKADYPWLPDALRIRWARTYGSLVHVLLSGANSLDDLGPCFGGDLYGREVDYLMQHEWAANAEDVLWRRTKCGLRFPPSRIGELNEYIKEVRNGPALKEAAL